MLLPIWYPLLGTCIAFYWLCENTTFHWLSHRAVTLDGVVGCLILTGMWSHFLLLPSSLWLFTQSPQTSTLHITLHPPRPPRDNSGSDRMQLPLSSSNCNYCWIYAPQHIFHLSITHCDLPLLLGKAQVFTVKSTDRLLTENHLCSHAIRNYFRGDIKSSAHIQFSPTNSVSQTKLPW